MRQQCLGYLQDKLVRVAEFGGVLVEALILFDLLVIGGVQQQLLDVGRLQPLCGHGHQHLAQFARGQLQVGNQDGWRSEVKRSKGQRSEATVTV